MNSALMKKVAFIAVISIAANWLVRRAATSGIPVVSTVAGVAAS